MSNSGQPDISKLFEDGTEIDRAMRKGVRDALKTHKAAGNPIAIWRDDAVVWIPPDQIEIPELDEL